MSTSFFPKRHFETTTGNGKKRRGCRVRMAWNMAVAVGGAGLSCWPPGRECLMRNPGICQEGGRPTARPPCPGRKEENMAREMGFCDWDAPRRAARTGGDRRSAVAGPSWPFSAPSRAPGAQHMPCRDREERGSRRFQAGSRSCVSPASPRPVHQAPSRPWSSATNRRLAFLSTRSRTTSSRGASGRRVKTSGRMPRRPCPKILLPGLAAGKRVQQGAQHPRAVIFRVQGHQVRSSTMPRITPPGHDDTGEGGWPKACPARPDRVVRMRGGTSVNMTSRAVRPIPGAGKRALRSPRRPWRWPQHVRPADDAHQVSRVVDHRQALEASPGHQRQGVRTWS